MKYEDYELIDQVKLEEIFKSMTNEPVIVNHKIVGMRFFPENIKKFDFDTSTRGLYAIWDNSEDALRKQKFQIDTSRIISIKYEDVVPQICGKKLQVDFYGGNSITFRQQSGYKEDKDDQ